MTPPTHTHTSIALDCVLCSDTTMKFKKNYSSYKTFGCPEPPPPPSEKKFWIRCAAVIVNEQLSPFPYIIYFLSHIGLVQGDDIVVLQGKRPLNPLFPELGASPPGQGDIWDSNYYWPCG